MTVLNTIDDRYSNYYPLFRNEAIFLGFCLFLPSFKFMTVWNREKEEEIKLVTFGSDTAKTIKTTQTKLSLKLKNGAYLELSANIVQVISGSVQRKAMKIAVNHSDSVEYYR